MWKKIRPNVLALIGFGYGTILLIFLVLVKGDLTATVAYDVVKGPLMALIGGSLAVAKDLVEDYAPPPPTPPPNSLTEGTTDTLNEQRETKQ